MSDKGKRVSYSEHIPVACHYNLRTLLTKNGELLQIIHLDGFARSDSSRSNSVNIRDAIRSSLKKHLGSKDLSAYLHVIRDRTSIALSGSFLSPVVQKIDTDWNNMHRWDKQLVNSMFITIVHKGIRSKIGIISSAIYSFICKKSNSYLQEAEAVLTQVADSISEELKSFGGYVLRIRKRQEDEKYVSDPLSFYYRLIYLRRKEIEVDVCDSSKQLESDLLISYGFNYTKITNQKQQKERYAALFTLKYPYDLSLEVCDNILNVDQYIIISETIYPAITSLAVKTWQSYKDICKAAGAEDMSISLGLEQLTDDKVYCKQQLSILVHAAEFEVFQMQLQNISSLLKNEGIVVVREDFYMPAAIWAILPGNSRYLERERYNLLEKAGIFTSIHHRNIGCYNGSRWGEAICIFRNISNIPYYFNFHNRSGNGHTLIIAPLESKPEILIRFLMVQSLRNHPRIIVLDPRGQNKNFISMVGGGHVDVMISNSQISFDVFDPKNFLSKEEWLNLLAKALFGDVELLKQTNIRDLLLNLHMAEDRSAYIESLLADDKISNRTSVEHVKEFTESQDYIIAMSSNSVTKLKNWQGMLNVDFSKISPQYQLLYASMLLRNILKFLDGMPAIIIVQHADHLLDLDQDEVNDLLQQAYKNNCIIIFSLCQKDRFFEQKNLPNLLQQIATKFFLSDRFADKSYKKLFELTDLEFHRIKIYDKSRRIFLLKQDDASVSASFCLSEDKDILEVDL